MKVIGDRFELVKRLGGGGYGDVWQAVDQRLGRHVAVKVFRARSNRADEAFMREARITAQLEHERIVRLYDFGFSPSLGHYLVLELIKGGSLDRYLDALQLLPIEQRVLHVTLVAVHVADALAEAHRAGVIHRDVKPENIFLMSEVAPYRAKLGDFGIASMAGEEGTHRRTFAYASPEQLSRQKLNRPTDVYSLGATLYALLMGTAPYRKETPEAQLHAIHYRDHDPIPDEIVQSAGPLCEMIESMLSFEAADRPSVQVVGTRLRGALATSLATLDDSLALDSSPATLTLPPPSDLVLKRSGIRTLYSAREHFAYEHPLDRLLQQVADGQFIAVGRTLRHVTSWGGALTAALQRGASIRLCLLHPDGAHGGGRGSGRHEILSSVAALRESVHPFIQRQAPRGRLSVSFHHLPGADSFLHARTPQSEFAAWQITGVRNQAEKRVFVIDSTVGIGRDLVERFEGICSEAEARELAYSYEHGKLLDRLPRE